MAASATSSSAFSTPAVQPSGNTPGINVPQTNAYAGGGGGMGNLTGYDYYGALSSSFNAVPGLGSLLSSLYGTKYGVPDPTATAGAAAIGNAGNLGAIGAETLGADAINAQGAALPFQMNLPNYSTNLATASGNVSQELQGQVPQDVQNLIAQNAAERGVSTGQGVGSPNTNASYLQALGLTSIGQEQAGLTGLEGLIGSTPTGTAATAQSGFVTPEQQQAAQLASNKEAAAPDPEGAGLLNTFMSVL